MAERGKAAALTIRDLHVYYGESHAIQSVSMDLDHGVLAVVGRNGMGKSTLCNAIAGLKASRSGSIRILGRETSRLEPHMIQRHGVGYVPQGRRLWPSLSVEEHLRLVATGDPSSLWTIERIYRTFPRLYERRTSGGSQLSGGEQQMLAISRALLGNPRLLIMDEPTEGLAPIIVDQVEAMLVQLADEGTMAILVIEQNIGVATGVSDHVAIMVNGRINRIMEARTLAADRELQQQLLGVGRQDEDDLPPGETAAAETAETLTAEVYRVARDDGAATGLAAEQIQPSALLPNRLKMPAMSLRQSMLEASRPEQDSRRIFAMPFSERIGRTAIVAGTFDTKGPELKFIRDRLKALGIPTRTVDLSTSGKPSTADVTPLQVASMHPSGTSAVFSDDRGHSVTAMAEAFARWVAREPQIGGIISAGGSGGTTLATAGMRALPIGIPKVMVSTVAASDVRTYVGGADINMFHSVADVQGINSIMERVLANAAHALAGMIAQMPMREAHEAKRKMSRPAVGITMFGVTTPCVQGLTKELEADYECIVFHATGIGGQAMEQLADSGLLAAMLDITTTEVADMVVGGVFPATQDRFGSAIRTGIPYVGSTGALDIVNFGAKNTVPEKFRQRNLVVHNPTVTAMRTTAEENRTIGEWIVTRLNLMTGPVRFVLPLGGCSLYDMPGKSFYDPAADSALFETIEKNFRVGGNRKLIKVQGNINDPVFISATLAAFKEIAPTQSLGGGKIRKKEFGSLGDKSNRS